MKLQASEIAGVRDVNVVIEGSDGLKLTAEEMAGTSGRPDLLLEVEVSKQTGDCSTFSAVTLRVRAKQTTLISIDLSHDAATALGKSIEQLMALWTWAPPQ